MYTVKCYLEVSIGAIVNNNIYYNEIFLKLFTYFMTMIDCTNPYVAEKSIFATVASILVTSSTHQNSNLRAMHTNHHG